MFSNVLDNDCVIYGVFTLDLVHTKFEKTKLAKQPKETCQFLYFIFVQIRIEFQDILNIALIER